MKLNKDNWINTIIENIADEVSDRVENPSQSEYKRFVGLEEFETGEFKIRKCSSTENLVSAMKLFKAGDVLFARRNAYLRRASKVDFDGVCSGDAIVLRPKKYLQDDILTFVLNTNKFWDYAFANATGTMSKRVKWRDLAKYSFLLPSSTEQTQIAELFQSIETAIDQAEQQEKNLRALQNTLSNGLANTQPTLGNLLNKKNCTPTNFGGVADCIEKHDKQKKDVSRFIGLENIEPENLNISTWGNIEDGTTFTKRFSKGDVLFGKRRAYLKKVAVADFDGICSGDIFVLRAKEKKILPELLPFYVSAEAFIQHAVHTSAGSLSPRTKWKDLSSFEIAIPDLKTQENIFEVFQQIQITLEQIKTQKQTLKTLKQKLLNEILG